jgi:hypothetical protein
MGSFYDLYCLLHGGPARCLRKGQTEDNLEAGVEGEKPGEPDTDTKGRTWN